MLRPRRRFSIPPGERPVTKASEKRHRLDLKLSQGMPLVPRSEIMQAAITYRGNGVIDDTRKGTERLHTHALREIGQFEVRRVAEAVWGLTPGTCQPSFYPDDPQIQELDGIARLRDVTHLIMATTSTRLDKAKDDVKKLNAAEAYEEKTAVMVSKWFITEKQLDAQHIDYARKNKVTAITLDQFTRRFFDNRKYISLRRNGAFGSARDLENGSTTIDDSKYVELPIMLIADKQNSKALSFDQDKQVNLSAIKNCIKEGNIAILIAPFGAGKSITTRQIFLELAEEHLKDQAISVPFALNLREHWGQGYADEILDRHARSIGYMPREDLTIAWRAGMSSLLLDGFDEVAAQGVIRKDNKTFMRMARRDALSGVRDFITKIPAGIGVFISGRDHYFDDEQEIASALSISNKRCQVFRLGEFTDAGVKEFLQKNGIFDTLPDWLPRKPLLLGYLIQRDLIREIVTIDGATGFAHAWDTFLTKIAQREAELESSTMEAETLRSVMERIAFSVRERSSGTGPVTGSDLSSAFSIETGQAAGEGVLAQLQRLPGLTQRDQDPGARSFVDEDMLAALQGGAFYRFVIESFKSYNTKPLAPLSSKAVNVAAHLLQRDGYKVSTLISVAMALLRHRSSSIEVGQVLSDIVAVALNLAISEGLQVIDFNGLIVQDALIGKLNFEEIIIKGISFDDCMISELVINSDAARGDVIFQRCLISQVGGVADKTGLPPEIFMSCDVERFDQMGTTNAVLQLNLSSQLKALITVLRKLYKQAGGGRQMNALFRGITQRDVSEYIERVVQVLENEGFVFITNDVVHPVRKERNRVEQILVAPSLSTDPVVAAVLSL